MTDLLLALDLGTGSVKAVVTAADGLEPVARASYPCRVRSPRPGWAEADPGDWAYAVATAVARVLTEVPTDRLAAIGLSGQMHGVVLCDETGIPVRPAVLWADGRAVDAARAYAALGQDALTRLANPVVAGMAGPTLHWLARNEPDSYRAAQWALQPKDWLRLRLTGVAGTEPSDASATLLWDVAGDRWDRDVIEGLGLRADLLAPPARSRDVGGVSAGVLGLPPGVPVACGGGDTACAAYGAGLVRPGDAQLSTGTGGQIIVVLDRPAADRSRRTHLYRTVQDSGWYAMAAIQNVGLALERAWRMLDVTWPQAYALAARVPVGSGGVTFVPHLAGERTPYLDSTLRGGWVGLGLSHEREHLVRAAFEGVAFALRQGLDALRSAGHDPAELALTGGGSLEQAWRQLLADALGLPLVAHDRPDASARGAAALAAQAIGRPVEVSLASKGDVTEPDPTVRDAVADAYDAFQRRCPLL